MAQVNTDRNHGLFLHEQLAHLHTENIQKKVSNIASDEDIMENNYMFVMELKHHKSLDFPTMLFCNSGAKSKNNLTCYNLSLSREHHQKRIYFLIS